MKTLWRHRPSPAIVLACLALAVALGGTGYAAIVLPANSVGTKQLKNNAVNSIKVANGSLLKADFKAGQIPAGAAGPAGPAGPAGAAGAAGPAGPFPDALPDGEDDPRRLQHRRHRSGSGRRSPTRRSRSSGRSPRLPTVRIVLQGATAPAECPGNATSPQAQTGFLCIYEESRTNTVGRDPERRAEVRRDDLRRTPRPPAASSATAPGPRPETEPTPRGRGYALSDERCRAPGRESTSSRPSRRRSRRCRPTCAGFMSNVAIFVEDEPPAGMPLLGLYQGYPLTTRTSGYVGVPPDRITIYRGPLERLYGADPERLRTRDPPRRPARDRPPLRDQRRAPDRARPLLT